MDLIERYLGAIARHLPDAQKADVTAELRDVLLSQVEDEETRLGRPLILAEIEALLVRFGHPLTISGRYRKVQHLIGPEVFPFWRAGLKATLVIVIGVYLVLVALDIVGGQIGVSGRSPDLPSFEVVLIFAFGAVTLVCALIERFGKTAMLRRWKPSELPPPQGRSRSPFDIVVEIGVGAIFILWWIGVISFRNVIPEYALRVDLAPIWAVWFWPILIYSAYEMAANFVALLRPGRVRLVEALLLIGNLAAVSILGAIYQAGQWLEVTSTVMSPAALTSAQAHFDRGMGVGILGAIAVFLILAGVNLWRLRQAGLVLRGSTSAPAS